MRCPLTSTIILLAMVGTACAWQRTALVTAHRGTSLGPECTIVSAEMAFDLGADIIEIDVRKSSDGVLVNFHDATLDRTTDGTGNLADFTLAELKLLDAGSWKAPEFTGERIPTLEEMLNLAISRNKGAFLDIKVASPAEVSAVVTATNFSHADLTILTWSTTQASQFAAEFPSATIAYTPWSQPAAWDASYFDQMKLNGVDAFAFWYASVTQAFIQDAQSQGMPVYSFTINQTATAQELADDGLSMIITDYCGTILNDVDWDPSLKVRSFAKEENGSLTLKWRAIAGNSYRIERSSTMAPDSWTPETTVIAPSILPTYPITPSENRAFYRVVKE